MIFNSNNKLFFVDAETDGLYGPFITVAVIVTDSNCIEIERAYLGVKKDALTVSNEWTIENVIPILGDYLEFDNEEQLLEAVWSLWSKYKDTAYAVGDVVYPVEARLFEKCVEFDVENRSYGAPFPLLDISSFRFIKRMDPLGNALDAGNCNERRHNALYDVEEMIKQYKQVLGGCDEIS